MDYYLHLYIYVNIIYINIYVIVYFIILYYILLYYITLYICKPPPPHPHTRAHFLGKVRKPPTPSLCKRVGSNYVKMLVVKPKS